MTDMKFTLFCGDLRNFYEIHFGAIYALLRGEKLSQKFVMWRKKYKYQVWWIVRFFRICIFTIQ